MTDNHDHYDAPHDKAHREAHNARMGLVGILQSCVCTWPNEREDTETQHHRACPAHRMLLAVDAERHEAERAVRTATWIVEAMGLPRGA